MFFSLKIFLENFSELFYFCYAPSLVIFVLYAHLNWPDLLVHGRGRVKYLSVSKRFYLVFYILGVFYSVNTFFMVYTLRRTLETWFYTKHTESKMSMLHLLHGSIFYTVLGKYFKKYSHNLPYSFYYYFMLLNILQGYFHYKLYVIKDENYNYTHYVCEILFYMLYLYYIKSWFMLNMLVYTTLFVYISVKQRVELRNR